jgi:hypothetical protein
MWRIFKTKPRSFDIHAVPPLDVSKGSASVDIGFLPSPAHDDAFVALFEKVLRDTSGFLNGWTLSSISAKYPLVDVSPTLKPPLSFESLLATAQEAGRTLYLSRNDDVQLTFERDGQTVKLLVVFDNPYFQLQGRPK